MKATIAVLLCLVPLSFSARLPLTPTPIENGGLYRLENQEDGAYLSAGSDGVVKGGEYTGQPGQKWIFKQIGEDTYQLTSSDNASNNVSSNTYKVTLVGHGKRIFKNVETGLCFYNAGRGRPLTEKECSNTAPRGRWFVDTVTY